MADVEVVVGDAAGLEEGGEGRGWIWRREGVHDADGELEIAEEGGDE